MPRGQRVDRTGVASVRIVRTVDLLHLAPGASVLEIGCGGGLALAEIFRREPNAVMVGIDRSPTMIARAEAANAGAIRRGLAQFVTSGLLETDLAGQAFDIAFAINVNAFWVDGRREMQQLRSLIAPGGRIHLVYEAPTAARHDAMIATISVHFASARLASPSIIDDRQSEKPFLALSSARLE